MKRIWIVKAESDGITSYWTSKKRALKEMRRLAKKCLAKEERPDLSYEAIKNGSLDDLFYYHSEKVSG